MGGGEGNAFNFTVPWSAGCHIVGSGHSIQDPAAPTPCQSLVHSKHDHFSWEFIAIRNVTSNPITVTSDIKQLTLMMISEQQP